MLEIQTDGFFTWEVILFISCKYSMCTFSNGLVSSLYGEILKWHVQLRCDRTYVTATQTG